ncbi:hypothetical protein [Oleiagrimonas sp. C23AA]|uniref:hypothetical protein n=1 Tax=Oleiagrimonas sp. C23AA TaxID=2719047 RepID=UPI0014212544|nr:hypothetical protein [Oleiagrimonas sp. C23AA]NII10127.1 hypothetical protein [Oleiagrimonas sp. C23AA]
MDYFDEKSAEISVDAMTSFGVEIHTRYGKAWQMAEMLMFTTDLANLDLHHFVTSVFYDSKSDCCSFEFGDEELLPEVDEAILRCAEKHISQFEWHGTIYHGGTLGAA